MYGIVGGPGLGIQCGMTNVRGVIIDKTYLKNVSQTTVEKVGAQFKALLNTSLHVVQNFFVNLLCRFSV